MSSSKWMYLTACFHFLCWSAVLSLVSYWIYVYNLNKDLCLVDYKNYFETESDEPPVLSICLNNPISEEQLKINAPQTDLDTYMGFLNGSYFNTSLLDIDYQKVILDMSEYTSRVWLNWANGTTGYSPSTKGVFKSTNAFIYHNRFYQCYRVQPPKERGLTGIGVTLNSTVFPDRKRPQNYEMFSIMHYPNHLFKMIPTKRWAVKRESNDKYKMRYRIDGVEVVKRRNKKSRPCYDWSNFDAKIIENHIKKVGCRASYQPAFEDVPVCLSQEGTNDASQDRVKLEYGIEPPCKSMETIYYTYSEADSSHTHAAEQNMVEILIAPYNKRFKEILQTRAIDIQALIGNIGGYIGLCLGYSILQIPDFIVFILCKLYSYFPTLRNDKLRMDSRIPSILKNTNLDNVTSNNDSPDLVRDLSSAIFQIKADNAMIHLAIQRLEQRIDTMTKNN